MQDYWKIKRGTLDEAGPTCLDNWVAPTGTFASIFTTSPTPTYHASNTILALEEPSITILITELESGYMTLKPIFATARKVDEGFIASFPEANIHASGDSIDEAASNLKYIIIDVFDLLRSHEVNSLGPEPKRQRAILSSYIVKA